MTTNVIIFESRWKHDDYKVNFSFIIDDSKLDTAAYLDKIYDYIENNFRFIDLSYDEETDDNFVFNRKMFGKIIDAYKSGILINNYGINHFWDVNEEYKPLWPVSMNVYVITSDNISSD